jgi:hypothetical protein
MKANPFIFGKRIAQLIGLGHGVLPPSRIFAAKDKLNPKSGDDYSRNARPDWAGSLAGFQFMQVIWMESAGR